jgi:Arc/MetJ-type ribon-helix-helix transcriptional regulator
MLNVSPSCIADWYAKRMAQLVTRLDDRLLAEVDELVSEGVAATRSDAVRLGLEALIDRHRRQQTGQVIVDAYRRHPQDDDELAGLDQATLSLVGEEPW